MSRGKMFFLPAALLVLIVGGIAWIFQLRVAGGDFYPLYSSLRADALGTRALYEALEQLPEMTVEREFRAPAQGRNRRRVVLIAGAAREQWQSLPEEKFQGLNSAALNGARIVVAFQAELMRAESTRAATDAAVETDPKKSEEKKPAQKRRAPPGFKEPVLKELEREWGVKVTRRWLFTEKPGLEPGEAATIAVPAHLPWKSDVFFALKPESGWRVLFRRAGEPVIVEKQIGAGSIVLLADAYGLSNEALQKTRATELLAWLFGDYQQVTFAESELGLREEVGVGALARRYGLGGALAVLLLLGALYAWRRLVEFVPRHLEERTAPEVTLAHEPTAGLAALLQRSLNPGVLLATCVEEWRKSRPGGSARSSDVRLETAWADSAKIPGGRRTLSQTYNALVRALKPR